MKGYRGHLDQTFVLLRKNDSRFCEQANGCNRQIDKVSMKLLGFSIVIKMRKIDTESLPKNEKILEVDQSSWMYIVEYENSLISCLGNCNLGHNILELYNV